MKKIASLGDLAPDTNIEGHFEQQAKAAKSVEHKKKSLMARSSFTLSSDHIEFLTQEAARLTVKRKKKVSSSELLREIITTYQNR